MSHLAYPKPDGVAAGNRYSHVVTGQGRWVAIAGQVALDETGELVGPGDAAAQARQVFANLDACLKAAGATFADVVKFGIYVTDMADLPAIRAARDAYIDLDVTNPPASTAVQVVALFKPDVVVEIDAFAIVAD